VLGDDKLKTVSTVQGLLSAFKYLHDEQEPVMEIPVETKKNLAKFMAGYKRKIASKKENGEMKSQEGKDAFKMESYTYICKCLLVLMPAMLAMSLHLFCILSRLWTQNYHARLAPFVVCGIFRCPHTGLAATGVTLNTAIMTSVKEVTTEVAQLRQEVESITEKLTNTIPRECVNLILDNVNISGTQPVTRQSLVELEGRLVEAIQTQLLELTTTRTRKI
jgi:hypothetical protein